MSHSAQNAIAHYEQTIADIAKRILEVHLPCPGCEELTLFRSTGVGGTVAGSGYRKLQIQCRVCKRKIFFTNLLKLLDGPVTATSPFKEAISTAAEAMRTLNSVLLGRPNRTIDDFFSRKRSRPASDHEEPLLACAPAPTDEARPDDESDSAPRPEVEALREENEKLKKQLEAKDKELTLLKQKFIELEQHRDTTDARLEKLETALQNRAPPAGILSWADQVDLEENSAAKPQATVPNSSAKKPSYANAVISTGTVINGRPSRKPNKALSFMAKKSIYRNGPAVTFKLIQFKLASTAAMKKLTSNLDKLRLIWKLTETLGIRNSVFEVSRIGNSIVELYVIEKHYEQIRDTLESFQLEIVTVNPMDVPDFGKIQDTYQLVRRRKGAMFKRARLVNLRNTILADIPKEMANEIRVQFPSGTSQQPINRFEELADAILARPTSPTSTSVSAVSDVSFEDNETLQTSAEKTAMDVELDQ